MCQAADRPYESPPIPGIADRREACCAPAVSLRALTVWALLAASVPSFMAQEDTRDDGIKALLRGDYAEAVRILRPLAEDARPGDHTAQFLMALLYDSGKGVAPNSIRACALAAAAASTGGPFTEQATQLARLLREESAGTTRLCGGGDAWRTLAPPSRLMTRIGATASFASDGVIAIARGDYDAAVQHLRVLGEGDFSTDSVAQFFMGVLYQSGHGVKADPLRACALYHRAARADASPFGAEALRFVKALWREHDNNWLRRCQTLSGLSLSRAFHVTTFDLAPGHTVAWDLEGARITYEGKVTRFNFTPAGRSGVLLPARHTRLVTGTARETRDFIEVAAWHLTGPAWKFQWYLMEVDRDQIRVAASHADLLTTQDPPDVDRPLDLRTVIALGVNAAGAAEWSSLVPGRQRPEIIESPGDRRRRAEEAAAHEAALARIDWSRTFDVSRTPSFRYLPAEGCVDLSLTALTHDRAEAIRVLVDKQGLRLGTSPRVVDLAGERRVSVSIRMYPRALRQSPFCTRQPAPPAEAVWRAVSGTITIELSAKRVAPNPELYRATIRLENAVFANDKGLQFSLPAPLTLSAFAGVAFAY